MSENNCKYHARYSVKQLNKIVYNDEVTMKGANKHNFKASIDFEADEAARYKLFEDLCEHLAEGYSMESFTGCSKFRLDKLIGLFPQVFERESLDKARQMGRLSWELIGKRQADGRCLGNSRTWFYNMANRYGWRDKVDLQAETKGQLSVQVVNYSIERNDDDSTDAPEGDNT